MLRTHAMAVVRRLREAGHQAVFAGGCVRDRLLGKEPADYDIATSARPEQVEGLFDRTIPVGRKFAVLVVSEGGHDFEVATFRTDGSYADGRHPDTVRYADAEQDALRRDFTINAMFEDPIADRTIDYVGGREDLAAGVIRAVGQPRLRFEEDHLRLLRAVRFAARFGFTIEPHTLSAMRAAAGSIHSISAERIGEELVRMLTEGRAKRAFELLDAATLLGHVLPEMLAMKGCEQSPDFHPEGDVYTHTLLCLEKLPAGCTETLAFGVLLHDVAKPPCAEARDGRHTFYGHTGLGARMAVDICRRLRRSNAVGERVAFLVDQHLRHCTSADMRPSTLKRFLRQEGIEELLELTRIDALSANGDLTHYEFCMRALADLGQEQIKPALLLNGNDLIALGLRPGPQFKEILHVVEDAQLEGQISTKAEAVELVRKNFVDAGA